jgi:hypothetical protein
MSRIFLALLFCLGFGASALADGKVFPPDNCSTANPFMAFNGVADNGNTYCSSGQDIFHNAIPTCAPDQIVAYNGTEFYCTDNTLNPPTCAPGEVLTGSGGSFTCVAQSSGSPTGSWCGLATANFGFVQWVTPSCSTASYSSVFTCNGSSVTSSCPSGYTLQSAMTAYVDFGAASGGGGSGYSYSCIRTCAKN